MNRILSFLSNLFVKSQTAEGNAKQAAQDPPNIKPRLHTGLSNANPNAPKEALDDENESEITCFGQIPHQNTDPDQTNRYPMRDSPIPYAGINYVLRTQAEIIQKIKVAVPLDEADKDLYLFPIIRNIAAYVHLLPASNNYHHKGRGGLLRHSLEVGLYTVNMARMHIFDQKADPEAKYRNKGRWFLACFIAGALHDIGKVLVSLTVCGENGSPIWHPASLALYDWLKKNKLKKYYLTWRTAEVNYSQHETAGAILFAQIVPQQTRVFLEEANSSTLMNELYDAVGGIKRKGALISNLVNKADQLSTSKDLNQQNTSSLVSHGVDMPIANILLDIIVSLVEDGSWEINKYQSGCLPSALWETSNGTYIVWDSAAQAVINRLNERSIQGVPRDTTVIAEKLCESGICQFAAASGQDRFWRISPVSIALADLTANGTQPIPEVQDDEAAYEYKFFAALRVMLPSRLYEHKAAPEKVLTAVLGRPLDDLQSIEWETMTKRKVPDSGPAEEICIPEEEAEANRVAQNQKNYDCFDEYGNPIISITNPKLDLELQELFAEDEQPDVAQPSSPVVIQEKIENRNGDSGITSEDVSSADKTTSEKAPATSTVAATPAAPVLPEQTDIAQFAPSVFRRKDVGQEKSVAAPEKNVEATERVPAAQQPPAATVETSPAKKKEASSLPLETTEEKAGVNVLAPAGCEVFPDDRNLDFDPDLLADPPVEMPEIDTEPDLDPDPDPVLQENDCEDAGEKTMLQFAPRSLREPTAPGRREQKFAPEQFFPQKAAQTSSLVWNSSNSPDSLKKNPKNENADPDQEISRQNDDRIAPAQARPLSRQDIPDNTPRSDADLPPAKEKGDWLKKQLDSRIEVAGKSFAVQTILERVAKNLKTQLKAGGGKLAQHVSRHNGRFVCPALATQIFLDDLKIPFAVFAAQCETGSYEPLRFNRALQNFEIPESDCESGD